MVKSLVLSEYSDNPPQASETSRVKIEQGPLYSLERVQELVNDENQLFAWTEKCRKDVHKLSARVKVVVASFMQPSAVYRDSKRQP